MAVVTIDVRCSAKGVCMRWRRMTMRCTLMGMGRAGVLMSGDILNRACAQIGQGGTNRTLFGAPYRKPNDDTPFGAGIRCPSVWAGVREKGDHRGWQARFRNGVKALIQRRDLCLKGADFRVRARIEVAD